MDIRKLSPRRLRLLAAAGLVLAGLTAFNITQVSAERLAQHPTVSVPTVTGTPMGAFITVNIDVPLVYVRTGPGLSFPAVGLLVTGQVAPAKAMVGDWIQIDYMGVPGNTGWVYGRLLVTLDGEVPEVTPPPTPTARVTATLDPTLAARYIVEAPPTRLPTFTLSAPLAVPTFAPVEEPGAQAGLPVGFIIIGMVVVGSLGILLSILRGR